MEDKIRCTWPGDDPLMTEYHDNEWGTPQHDDKILFEYIVLDTFQAGLSWKIILDKRENFRKHFSDFNPKLIAKYDNKKEQKLLNEAGIVRNRLKISATITNAQAFLKIQKEFGSFNKYLWKFVDNKPIQNKWRTLAQIPAKTTLSDAISIDLKKRDFRFVGSTIVYAFLQGAGLVNDHLVSCFRYKQVAKKK